MRTFLCAVLIALLVAYCSGCASTAERLADKCYAFGGKPDVAYSESAGRVECK